MGNNCDNNCSECKVKRKKDEVSRLPEESIEQFIERLDKWDRENHVCINDGCPQCSGTGVNRVDGTPCIHYVSCRCPKCSPFRF